MQRRLEWNFRPKSKLPTLKAEALLKVYFYTGIHFMRYSTLFAFGLFVCVLPLYAQDVPDRDAIVKVVHRLFEGMQKGDSAMVSSTFAKEVTMATMRRNKENKAELVRENSIAGFLKAVGTPHPDVWYEEVWNLKVQQDDNFAQVWCDYAFYVGNRFSHCGVDALNLYKGEEGWKIFHLADTRRSSPCSIPLEIQNKHK